MKTVTKYATAIMASLLCALVVIIACMTVADVAHTTARANQIETRATEHTYKVVEKESVTESITEPSTETEETTTETELETEETAAPIETIPKVVYFNVELPQYLQDYIISECRKVGIRPAIVVAMIERESRFNQYAMGDDGRSFGLMQIQPKWHLQRMIDLGCTDLFNPTQNVTVGINYLAELYNTYGDITKALVAYNCGSYNGTITNYATEVMARASELERGI